MSKFSQGNKCKVGIWAVLVGPSAMINARQHCLQMEILMPNQWKVQNPYSIEVIKNIDICIKDWKCYHHSPEQSGSALSG